MSKRENQKKGGRHLLSIFDRETARRERFFLERKKNENIRNYVLGRMEIKLGIDTVGNYSNVYYHIYKKMIDERVTAEQVKRVTAKQVESKNKKEIDSYIDRCIEDEVRKTIKKALKNRLKIIFKHKEKEREYMDFSDVRPPNPDTFFDELIVIKKYGVTDRFGITGTVELSFKDLYDQYEILIQEPTQSGTQREGGKSRRNKKSRSNKSRKYTKKNCK
jgi:hypothetical protein